MSRGIRKGAGPPEHARAEMMTVQEVAEYLDCHPYTVHRLLRQHEIPGFRLGGDWRLRRSDIDKWIAAGGGKLSGSAPVKDRWPRALPAKTEVLTLVSPRRAKNPPVPSGELEAEMMTLREAAQYLHCHSSTLYRLANAGMLPVFRVGGTWRFRRSDIEKWIRDRQQEAEDAGGLVEGGRKDKRRGPRPKAGGK